MAAPGTAAARLHRITDFGAYLVAEIDLASGQRIKAQLPPVGRHGLVPGQAVALSVGEAALFRDGAALWSSGAAQEV